jgi:hypothetical protein
VGAHVFDTGLAYAQRSLIRDAIVTRLSALLTTAAPSRYLHAVKPIARPYRGEGDEDGAAILVSALLGQAPAIAVALGRKTYEATDAEPYTSRGTIDVAIYVLSKHPRGLVDGRLKTDVAGNAAITADPGIEAMLEHVEELLLGQSLGIAGVSELRPVDEDEVATADDGTIWEQTYTIGVERQINPSRLMTTVIDSIEGRHTPHDIEDDDEESDEDLHPLVTTVAELDEPEEED